MSRVEDRCRKAGPARELQGDRLSLFPSLRVEAGVARRSRPPSGPLEVSVKTGSQRRSDGGTDAGVLCSGIGSETTSRRGLYESSCGFPRFAARNAERRAYRIGRVRAPEAPWTPRPGYEDWYFVSGFGALGPLTTPSFSRRIGTRTTSSLGPSVAERRCSMRSGRAPSHAAAHRRRRLCSPTGFQTVACDTPRSMRSPLLSAGKGHLCGCGRWCSDLPPSSAFNRAGRGKRGPISPPEHSHFELSGPEERRVNSEMRRPFAAWRRRGAAGARLSSRAVPS